MKTYNTKGNSILFFLLGILSVLNSQTQYQNVSKTVMGADLMITCPANQTETACQTQAAIDTKFSSWLSTAAYTGGCDVSLSNNSGDRKSVV